MNVSASRILGFLAFWLAFHAAVSGQNTAQEYFQSALKKSAAHEYPGAIDDYSRCIVLEPANAVAYNNRGSLKSMSQDPEGAVADLTRAIELDAKNASYYRNRGDFKLQLRDRKGAMEDYDKGVAVDPNYRGTYRARGALRAVLGDYEGAVADFDKSLKFFPKEAVTYLRRGNVKKLLGNLEGAMEDYTEAIKFDGKLVDAYYYRASGYYIKRDWPKALEDFKHAAENSSYHERFSHIGLLRWIIRVQMGEKDEADQELAKTFSVKPTTNSGEWKVKVSQLFLDQITESELLAAVRPEDDDLRQSTVADGFYFAAMKRLLAGDKTGAAVLFKKCIEADKTYKGTVSVYSEVELKRLEK